MLERILIPLQWLKATLRKLLDLAMSPWMKAAEVETESWRRDAEIGIQQARQLSGRSLLYAIGVTVTLLLLWSAFAEIDEVTRGEGKVIPSRQIQIIQSQDGGVVSEILVSEGEVVQADQLLVRLDSTRSQSSFREKLIEFEALTVKEARLRAVIEKTPFVAPDRSAIESTQDHRARRSAVSIKPGGSSAEDEYCRAAVDPAPRRA